MQSAERMLCGAKVVVMPPAGTTLPPCHMRVMRQRVIEQPDGMTFDYGLRFLPESEGARHDWFLELRHREAA